MQFRRHVGAEVEAAQAQLAKLPYYHVFTARGHEPAVELAEKIKAEFGRLTRIEGLPAADWVLIDAGDVIIHLFRPEVRSFYNLERMWQFGEAPAAPAAQA